MLRTVFAASGGARDLHDKPETLNPKWIRRLSVHASGADFRLQMQPLIRVLLWHPCGSQDDQNLRSVKPRFRHHDDLGDVNGGASSEILAPQNIRDA